MRMAAAFLCFLVLAITAPTPAGGQLPVAARWGESDDSYLTIHNVRAAHQLTLGAGARVGILGRSFDMEAHPELYAGGKDFLDDATGAGEGIETHHGYWMALALREIAPEAEIFALEAHSENEGARVEALVRALSWAVDHELDVVTYCEGAFSEEARLVLDPVVEATVEAGVVVVFVDYPHPLNLLPSGFGFPAEGGQRDPDLNIFSYDCTALFTDHSVAFVNPDDDGIQRHRPFLARPSTGAVTAGLVALMRSVDPGASPADIKRALMETSRSVEYGGRVAARVPDAFEALSKVVGVFSPEARNGMKGR